MLYRIKYWNGSDFVPVNNPSGLGLRSGEYNRTGFNDVKNQPFSDWRLIQQKISDGKSRNGWSSRLPFTQASPPVVSAGADRSVMPQAKHTFRKGSIGNPVTKIEWSKKISPGDVTFAMETHLRRQQHSIKPGEYILQLTVQGR